MEQHFLSWWQEIGAFDGDMLYMEDGSKVHHSKVAKQWKEDHHILTLKWVGNSPDLNPIENLWAYLKVKLRARWARLPPNLRPTTADEIWEAAKEEWDAIPMALVNKLCDSWQSRLKECIKRTGGHTKY